MKDSKNGTFLFLRDYMEYHADRFEDHSLMFYDDKQKLVALLPANRKGTELWSHQGLTYGGFVLKRGTHVADVGDMFAVTLNYLCESGYTEWYYKQVPTVYHQIPSEEDTYWLWRHGAEIVECNLMSAVNLKIKYRISPRRCTYAKKLRREGWRVVYGKNGEFLEEFWKILTTNLRERYGAFPVHTLGEMKILQGIFPENIRCYGIISPEGIMEGGALMYISAQVARTQYISTTMRGKKDKVLDVLFEYLLETYEREGFHFFDFGTSMADDGIHLNEGLIVQKEGFGARSIACRIYRLKIEN